MRLLIFFLKLLHHFFVFMIGIFLLKEKLILKLERIFIILLIDGKKIKKTGVKLLWGTANVFSHKRYMGGASTNPDPEVFAYVAAQVKDCMEATNELRW